MAINILDMLKSQLGGQIAGQLGKQFGENEQATKSGIDALIPTILGGLLKQVAAPGGADKLDKTMKEGGYDGGLLDGLSGMLTGGGTDALTGKGNDVVSSLFGDKVALLLPILSKVTGLKLDSLKSLLAIVAPLILSFLGKQQKALGLDASGLASMLMSQKDSIGAALPPGVSDAMGLGSLGIASPAMARPAVAAPAPASSGGAMKVLIPLAILAAVGYGCYLYIFAGIRPSGPEGNVVMDVIPEEPAPSAPKEPMAAPSSSELPTEAPESATEKPAASGLGGLELPDLSKLPGLEGAPDLKALFGSMADALGKVKDVDTAKAAVPELEAMDKQLDSVSSGFSALPEAVRGKLSEAVVGMLPDLQGTIDKVLAIPGVGEILKPIIDQVLAKLTKLKG
jgi:hypothetical protein